MNNSVIDSLIGERFGRLIVLQRIHDDNNKKSIRYECLCDCGNVKIVRKDHLLDCGVKSCGCLLHKAKETTDIYKQKVYKKNPYLEFIDEPDNYDDYFRVKCHLCNGIFLTTRSNGSNGKCPICANQLVVKGINDVATVASWMVQYFVDKTEAEKYTIHSDHYVEVCCPCCNAKKRMQIKKLYERGFSCPCCDDKISYPNKYIRSFLRQLPVQNLIFEYCPNWNNKIFYDNYFEFGNKQYIVEADGIQHFDLNNRWNNNGDVIIQDHFKNRLAQEHNIQMIRIDCKNSYATYIQNSIKNSILADVFDLSNIDWMKCANDAACNLIYETAKYYEEHGHKIKDIAKKFGIAENTVYRYLNIAKDLNLCNYQTSRIKYNTKNSLFVSICEFYNDNPLITITEIGKIFKKDRHAIQKALLHGTEQGICNYVPRNRRKK